MLGQPGDFDATGEDRRRSRSAFHISPVLFLPLARGRRARRCSRFPPFTAIFLGAHRRRRARRDRRAGARDRLRRRRRGPAARGSRCSRASGSRWRAGTRRLRAFAPIDLLASRGGMDSMLNTIWLIITALAFGGVVEKAGVLDRLITPIIEKAKSDGALVASLVASIFATNVITADQYIAIVLPGRMFKTRVRAARARARRCCRAPSATTATPTSALIPWNSCGAYMAATLGVATWSYAPYAVFSYRQPAAGDRHRLCRHPDAARARGAGTRRGRTGVCASRLNLQSPSQCCGAAAHRRKCAINLPTELFRVSQTRTRHGPPHRRARSLSLALATLHAAVGLPARRGAARAGNSARARDHGREARGRRDRRADRHACRRRPRSTWRSGSTAGCSSGNVERRRHRAAGPARRAARLAERGEQPAGGAGAARRRPGRS